MLYLHPDCVNPLHIHMHRLTLCSWHLHPHLHPHLQALYSMKRDMLHELIGLKKIVNDATSVIGVGKLKKEKSMVDEETGADKTAQERGGGDTTGPRSRAGRKHASLAPVSPSPTGKKARPVATPPVPRVTAAAAAASAAVSAAAAAEKL